MNVIVVSLIAPLSLGAIISPTVLVSSPTAALFASTASAQCQGDCQSSVAPGGGILALLDKIASPASTRPARLYGVESQTPISIIELTAPAIDMLYGFISAESSSTIGMLDAWPIPTVSPKASMSAEFSSAFGAMGFAGSAGASLDSAEPAEVDDIATVGLDSAEFDPNQLDFLATEDSLNSDWAQNDVAGLDLNRAAADDGNADEETFDVKLWGDGVKRAADEFVDNVGSALGRFFPTRGTPAATVSHVVRIEPVVTDDQWI
ncbi:hypothetical protein DL89DRAFT_267549 [Linderina pennispora]|uniref:Uncharacterized protein n=1 Tax=Linderina pennispora TaxID=61395 RepID=A0A1Y1WAY4_9FUNG|nr:uncharacterized protein DL89DRAFT_267549 [Linderina pennispora]ORX70324.1 hypothetical protein DL89DRAFT_267549 [Linderina pennispora]